MARTALASMERPEFYDSPESVAKVLDAIVRTSETTRDWIGVEGAKIGYADLVVAAKGRQQTMGAGRPSWGGGVTKPLQKSKIWITCRGALLLSCPLERAFLSRRRSVYLCFSGHLVSADCTIQPHKVAVTDSSSTPPCGASEDRLLVQALQRYVYPGASLEAMAAVIAYCQAQGLDPFHRPLQVRSVMDPRTGRQREVITPGSDPSPEPTEQPSSC